MPEEVQHEVGQALFAAQAGGMARNARPLKGYHGAGVVEIIEGYDGDAYRAVYTVRFAGVGYALHVFQKKSTQGIRTSPRDMALVKQRLEEAEYHDRHVFPGMRRG